MRTWFFFFLINTLLSSTNNFVLTQSSGDYSGRWAALQQLALMFFNTNFGINFILYCLTGQNFRRELCQSVPCLRQRTRPTDDMQLVCRNVGRAGSVTSKYLITYISINPYKYILAYCQNVTNGCILFSNIIYLSANGKHA